MKIALLSIVSFAFGIIAVGVIQLRQDATVTYVLSREYTVPCPEEYDGLPLLAVRNFGVMLTAPAGTKVTLACHYGVKP